MVVRYVAIALLVLLSSAAYAEEPRRGRTADGRAYRVDADGNQLVDYIAELELAVDELNRRIVGLESEGEEKQRTIDQLRLATDERGIAELDIVPTKSRATSAATSALAIAECSKRELDEISARERGCRGEVLKLTSSLHDKEVALAERMQAAERLSLQVSSAEKRVAELLAKAQAAESAADAQAREVAALQQNLQAEKQRVQQVAIDSARVRASVSSSKIAAFESLRGRVRGDINRLAQRIARRDEVFKSFKGSAKGLTFSLQAAVSRSGRSLAKIRDQVSHARSVREISDLQREVLEIQRIIDEDIALIERASRLS